MSTSIYGADGQSMPDTFAIASEPTRVHNKLTYVTLDATTAFGYWTASLASIPRDAVIDTATRYDYTAGNWGGTYELTTFRADSGFDVGALNWNNKPGTVGTGVAVSHAVSALGTEYAFDLTDKVQAALAEGNPANFITKLTAGSGPVRATSMEWGGVNTPMLVIEWHAAGQKPSQLSPNGKVATDKPLLTGFPKGTTEVRVQVNSAASPFNNDTGFTSADWESSAQPVDAPQYNLALSTFPGLPPNTPQWWTVSTKVGGNWSKYSDPISMAYVANIPLAISAPSAAYPVVTDTSPTVSWVSTGQTRFHPYLVKTDGTKDPVWDPGWIVGTDQQYTIPSGKVTDRTFEGYRLYVEATDDLDRVANAGALPFAREAQVFTYQEVGGVPPVSYFVVEQVGASPLAKATWFRTVGSADQWDFWQDHQWMATLQPEDVANPDTGGWEYTFTNWTPGESHTWYVTSVVNGHASESGPRWTDTFTIGGHNVVDAENDLYVFLANAESTSYQVTDQVTMVQPLGSPWPVGLSTALGGLRGTLTGLIGPWMGRTLAEWATDWQTMRGNRLRTISYATGLIAFPAVLWNMTPPVPEPRMSGIMRVSCEYAQVDNLTLLSDLPDGTDLLDPPDPDVEYTYAASSDGHVLTVGEYDITAVAGSPTVHTALSIHTGMKGWS